MEDTVDVRSPETFSRVWKRVMPEGGPIVPSAQSGAGPAQQPVRPLPFPVERGTVQSVEPSPTQQTAFPAAQGASAPDFPLGAGSAAYTSFLRAQVEAQLRDAATCRFLSNQMGGNSLLREMAQDALRRAKRLAAALLLISGVWYLPQSVATPRRWPDWRGGLRGLFVTFQRGEWEYAQAAAGVQDPELKKLLQELAEELRQAQGQVRWLLER